MMKSFVGLDVQCSRGCPFAILKEDGNALEDGWIEDGDPERLVQRLKHTLKRYALKGHEIAIAIDAPRKPLAEPRLWQWNRDRWKHCRDKNGRHCEIVVHSLKLATPQWTRVYEQCENWMKLGFRLFEKLNCEFGARVYEVFPSASYTMLLDDPSAQISLRLGQLRPGPKDMLDAYMAATTLREFLQGRGSEVGGGDGLGTIVLPRPIPDASGVLVWPE